MNNQKWNICVFIGIIFAVTTVISVNYLVDPYEIFHTGSFRPGTPTNDRFNKVEHLVNSQNQYTSYYLGSSVMGAFEPQWVQEIFPAEKFYNASFLGGQPAEALKLLKLLKQQNRPIKRIIMGIDLFPFLMAEDSDSPSKRHHYLITGESKISFYTSYVFASSVWHSISKTIENGKPVPDIVFDINNTGRYYLVKQQKEMDQNIDLYVKENFAQKKPSISASSSWIEVRFTELKQLVDWSKSNNIHATYFIHPFHHSLRDSISSDSMIYFRKRVFEITGPIPDLTTRIDITDQDKNYYDPKHYTPSVAKQIINELYSQPTMSSYHK